MQSSIREGMMKFPKANKADIEKGTRTGSVVTDCRGYTPMLMANGKIVMKGPVRLSNGGRASEVLRVWLDTGEILEG